MPCPLLTQERVIYGTLGMQDFQNVITAELISWFGCIFEAAFDVLIFEKKPALKERRERWGEG